MNGRFFFSHILQARRPPPGFFRSCAPSPRTGHSTARPPLPALLFTDRTTCPPPQSLATHTAIGGIFATVTGASCCPFDLQRAWQTSPDFLPSFILRVTIIQIVLLGIAHDRTVASTRRQCRWAGMAGAGRAREGVVKLSCKGKQPCGNWHAESAACKGASWTNQLRTGSTGP